jgi:6-pyruvoyltetrahydropterin/6-carboxytetrahydropterin synthase
MTIFLTRVVRFSAAHRYHRAEWSDSHNRSVFGACNNPYGHGHNYVLEVMVAGEPDPQTGFCVDLAALDRALHEQVVSRLDHQHLNHAVAEFAEGGLIPTTENIASLIWTWVSPHIPEPARLVRLRLREDGDLWVDCYGPGPITEPGDWRDRLREV